MKIRIELHGVSFEYEKQPAPDSRFKTVCMLAAAGIYGAVFVKVAALCGVIGVAVVAAATLLIAGISRM